MRLNPFPVLAALILSLVSVQAQANMVTAVNLTNSGIDFSVNGGGGPLMPPNSNASSSGGACCAYMGSWSPNKTAIVKWKADQDPYSYSKNPHEMYSTQWYQWMREYKKDKVTYHKAEVVVPQYTRESAGNVIAIFLPCHQVMVVNTYKSYNNPSFPEKTTIQQRYRELVTLEKKNQCPPLQFPAKQKCY